MQFNIRAIILTGLLIVGSTNSFGKQELLLHNTVQHKILNDKTYNQIYIFVSFSMPDSALRSYFIEAEKIGAKLVMRGLKNNSFIDTKAKTDQLDISFDIDPELFKKYHITSVPAIIVTSV